MANIIYPQWYALSQVGKVVKQAVTKELVQSDEAFYYVRKEQTDNYWKQKAGILIK